MKITNCSHRPILLPCRLESFEYQIDPYIGCAHHCHYCYALNQAETDWTKEILIYEDISSQLGKELDKIPPQTIYMGYHTDPYQPCEAEYCQTRKVLELFLKNGFSASILTKSDIVIRDIEILKEMNDAAISVSVAFNDNQTRRLFEANTIDTEKRIEALNKLKEAGVRTGALLCPIIPYITDAIQMIDMLEPYADVIWLYGLSIEKRSDLNWQNLEAILKESFPDLREKIEEIVFSKNHQFWQKLRQELKNIEKNRQLDLNIHV